MNIVELASLQVFGLIAIEKTILHPNTHLSNSL